MSDVQKISVAVTGQQLKAIKDAVASGEYGSTSEVIREALRGWQIREPLRKAESKGYARPGKTASPAGRLRPSILRMLRRVAVNGLPGSSGLDGR